jgi:hypothetical protein
MNHNWVTKVSLPSTLVTYSVLLPPHPAQTEIVKSYLQSTLYIICCTYLLDAISCPMQMSGIAEAKFPYHHGHVLHFNCLWFHFELSSTFTHTTKELQNTAQVKTKSSGQSYIINWGKNDETQEESWMQYKLEYIALWNKRKGNEPNQIQSNWCWIESKGNIYIYIYMSKCGFLGLFIRDWNKFSSKKSWSSRF